jgi:hypothetical protein
MLSPKPIPKPKPKYHQRQNNHNNPQLVMAIQWMVEVTAELMRVSNQNLTNLDSKELPPRMQQVLDDHLFQVQAKRTLFE